MIANARAQAPFHIMTKPMGPLCNLDCSYCFYLEKARLFPKNERFRMNDAQLETYIKNYIEAQPGPQVSFAWQGGEPTLAGLDFFKKAVAFQKKYAAGKQIENALQTNGTLLDDAFCQFFHEADFLVGISIDGPKELHDYYRVDRKGQPTYDQVVRGIRLCQKHKVEFNTLTVVNRQNAEHPLKVYRHLRELGSKFIQFIPLVERAADTASEKLGLSLAHPPEMSDGPQVTEWSVTAKQYGNFLSTIFDRWVSRDVGEVYIQLFDGTLGKWLGVPGGTCTTAETCGRALAMEHNGDVYACDHYVYPHYRLGNVFEDSLKSLVDGPRMRAFGEAKRANLPKQCKACRYRFACNGDCPKHRFAQSRDGEKGLSYLCEGLYHFFEHSAPAMQQMAELYRQQRPVPEIMQRIR